MQRFKQKLNYPLPVRIVKEKQPPRRPEVQNELEKSKSPQREQPQMT